MKCFLIIILLVNVSAAPFFNHPFLNQPMEQQIIQQPMDQMILNQRPMDQMVVGQQLNAQFVTNQMMEQQLIEQLNKQNQYNALQQQLMAMQQLHSPYNILNGPVMSNLPPQPMILLIPNRITEISNRLETLNENDQPNTKLGNGDTESVVIDAEDESTALDRFTRQAIVVLPNGQRFFIGSIISAIPFLPFEVNVPDTIAWMYNGIASIIGGIGQRLPFRLKPTTEKPDSMQTQEPSQTSRLNLMQKLMTRNQNAGMPILILPVARELPIQVPIEV